ncbi:hypothetical protein CK203_029238 [Vitis vinifera]|uniref:Uncharacterized protein n=1 Tax=Vitis vinifera TaxID=29760 RepID=A0A438IT26_VITVI|nr:hypothetical protein CK203_029238 [Vitis vinifera]
MRKTSLGANACSASFVRRSAQAWALNPLRSNSMRDSAFIDLLFSNSSSTSLRFLQPSFIPMSFGVLMGYNVLDMLYRLSFTLLEVLFVYTVNMSQNERFSLSTHILSLQLVTRLPDSNKGKNKRGRLMEWVEKAYFAWLNKLFEISSFERNRQVLVTDKNLHAVVKEPNTWVELLAANTKPKIGIELVVPPIAYEEEKEDMAVNLRVGFKERQHKRLSKSITITLPPSKRPCPKILYSELVLTFALRPSSSLTQLNDDSVECVTSISSCPQAPHAPSWEEIAELMQQIPLFTKREAPVHNMEYYTVIETTEVHAQLFKWLEVVETMGTYIAHNMGDSEELRAKLKLEEGELAAAWKMTDEGARLLRKVEKGKEAIEAEARRLAEKRRVTQ